MARWFSCCRFLTFECSLENFVGCLHRIGPWPRHQARGFAELEMELQQHFLAFVAVTQHCSIHKLRSSWTSNLTWISLQHALFCVTVGRLVRLIFFPDLCRDRPPSRRASHDDFLARFMFINFRLNDFTVVSCSFTWCSFHDRFVLIACLFHVHFHAMFMLSHTLGALQRCSFVGLGGEVGGDVNVPWTCTHVECPARAEC